MKHHLFGFVEFIEFILSLGVSICLDMVSIETLDLDISKSWSRPSRKSRQVLKTGLDRRENLTVQKPSLDSLDYSKNRDFSIFVEILISTPKKSQSRLSRKSWQVLKTGLDAKDVLDLDLDWSQRGDPQAKFIRIFERK